MAGGSPRERMHSSKSGNRWFHSVWPWSVVVAVVLLPLAFLVWLFSGPDVGRSYVTGRSDLSVACNASCLGWAKGHAADFFESQTFPISRARNLRIALSQMTWAPAPDTILIQFRTTPKGLKRYLRGKRKLKITPAALLKSQDVKNSLGTSSFPYTRLNWWPPKAAKRPLIVYEADLPMAMNHYVFVNRDTMEVTILGNASRGR